MVYTLIDSQFESKIWASGEMVDTIGLGPIAARFGGSSPLSPT